MDLRKEKIHMVGIGGIGMSALAFILVEMGHIVSGSDVQDNDIMKALRRKGVVAGVGHDRSNIKEQDLVVYSSSIRMDNPEILAARERNIPIISRTELLKMIMDGKKKTVAITGTHGKTTTTAMSALLLEEAGLDPTVLIGGESPNFGGNAKFGKSDALVTEVDESDGRFVILKPDYIIISNLEKEHMEYYRDEAHLVDTFRRFLSAQSAKCVVFSRFEDANLKALTRSYGGKAVSFGFSPEADVYGENIKIGVFKIEFDCVCRKKPLGRFTINIPGIHNVSNALAVIALGAELGIDVPVMKEALFRYKNVKRRFDLIGEINGAKIVEDYAHHPTEIKATISAARSLNPKRLITVFQPHRYTRTKSFYKEFSAALAGSDEVILTEVYAASEERIEGASAKNIYEVMAKEDSIPVRLLEKSEITGYLAKKIKEGDIVLILGAGDIGKTAHEAVLYIKSLYARKA
ncbi:MAG: UDP-N-acetylmuramate--L-alanine ligase [Omnitrophica bacterium RBG_13_46_9]|nr:MAG: UDP-N-acetylmuramate--L-alanine ligase [Omnitrophica bacterium RBG_13_46_9]